MHLFALQARKAHISPSISAQGERHPCKKLRQPIVDEFRVTFIQSKKSWFSPKKAGYVAEAAASFLALARKLSRKRKKEEEATIQQHISLIGLMDAGRTTCRSPHVKYVATPSPAFRTDHILGAPSEKLQATEQRGLSFARLC